MKSNHTTRKQIKGERVLTVREVADLLHVHTNTVRNWCQKGILTSYRLGSRRDRRFESAQVLQLLKSQDVVSRA